MMFWAVYEYFRIRKLVTETRKLVEIVCSGLRTAGRAEQNNRQEVDESGGLGKGEMKCGCFSMQSEELGNITHLGQ